MKDEKITKTAYIANSGGLLGLCMGFSLGNQNYYLEILIAFIRRTIFSYFYYQISKFGENCEIEISVSLASQHV